jgi:hypothetical protein
VSVSRSSAHHGALPAVRVARRLAVLRRNTLTPPSPVHT